MEVGKGKVAVFGEAGMFTAQVVKSDDGEYAMGMAGLVRTQFCEGV